MWLKRKVLTWLVKDYLKLVLPEDIIVVRKGVWYVAGESIPPERARKLSHEADTMRQMLIWEDIKRHIHYLAFEKGMKQSSEPNDQYSAKIMIWLIEQIDKRLGELAHK